MYYSIILNTNTSQPMPQYYKWMYEEKKLMCDCCLTKLHCFSTSYKDKIENIWTTKEVEKRNPKCAQSEKKKKKEKKRSYFYLFRPIKCFIPSAFFSVCVYMKVSKWTVWKYVKLTYQRIIKHKQNPFQNIFLCIISL